MPDALLMVIYFLPVWLNFAAISLLSVFYANAMLDGYYQDFPWKICLIMNIIFLILNVTIATLLESTNVSENQNKVFYDVYVIYAIFLDILTACIIGYFGYQFIYNNQSRKNWLLPRSNKQFAVVNWLIVFCFLTRSLLVGLLSSNIIEQRSNATLIFNGEHTPTSVTILGFYFVTEWLPDVSLIYLLWRKSNTNFCFSCLSRTPKSNHSSFQQGKRTRRSFRMDNNGIEADYSDDFSDHFDDDYEVFLTSYNPANQEDSIYRPIATSVDEDETIKVIYGDRSVSSASSAFYSQQNSLTSFDHPVGVDLLLGSTSNAAAAHEHDGQYQYSWLGWFGWGGGGEGTSNGGGGRTASWSGNQRM